MSTLAICLLYPRKDPPPPRSIKPLHLEGTIWDPYPTGPSQVAVLPYPNLERKTRMYGLAI